METSASVTSVLSAVKQKLEFAYDSQSRRIQKKVYDWQTDHWSQITDLRFIYDGWNLLAEVGTTGSVVRSYVWGLDLSGSAQGAGGIGGLLFSASSAPQAVNFYAFDGNGNVAALLNADSGQPTAFYEYSPFGDLIRTTGSMAKSNPFRFSAKYTDDETGLLYYGYRYYQSSTGRWLSRDPIGERGGVNRYAICGNDTIRFVDPFGLSAQIVSAGKSAVGITVIPGADRGVFGQKSSKYSTTCITCYYYGEETEVVERKLLDNKPEAKYWIGYETTSLGAATGKNPLDPDEMTLMTGYMFVAGYRFPVQEKINTYQKLKCFAFIVISYYKRGDLFQVEVKNTVTEVQRRYPGGVNYLPTGIGGKPDLKSITVPDWQGPPPTF
jgi:RHS repeat-associated protein